jgi:hypothetical protein
MNPRAIALASALAIIPVIASADGPYAEPYRQEKRIEHGVVERIELVREGDRVRVVNGRVRRE